VVTDLFKEDAKSEKRIKGLSEKTKLLTYKIALIIADNKDEYTTKELAKTANNALEKGVDASFAIARISDEIIGISARSNDTFDVGKIMAELGGGGNRNSAATRIECSDVEDVSNRLRKIIKPKYYVDKEE
jgi:c-di-AMP phosphodiesterase-like protein